MPGPACASWTGHNSREQCTLRLQAAVLDAGCGTGILSVLATLRRAKVTAMDGSEAMLGVARQRLPASDVVHARVTSEIVGGIDLSAPAPEVMRAIIRRVAAFGDLQDE